MDWQDHDDDAAQRHGAGLGDFEDMDDQDPELAAAIAASFRSQGVESNEDDMLLQALELSRIEDEERRRREAAPAQAPQAPAALGEASRHRQGPCFAGVATSSPARQSAARPEARPEARPARPSRSGPADWDADLATLAGGFGFGDAGLGPGLGPGRAREREGSRVREASADEVSDSQLAAAIEASYVAQTAHGRQGEEQDLVQEAIRISQVEEESRQRALLKQQQEAELKESLLMDQLREQEEKRRRKEAEQLIAMEATRAKEEAHRLQQAQEAKRARVPPEPPAGEAGRVEIQIRTPDGRRIRRAFRGADTVGQVYDYIDVEVFAGQAVPEDSYRLVSTMPRQEYQDRCKTLTQAGLQGQCALIIEQRSPGA